MKKFFNRPKPPAPDKRKPDQQGTGKHKEALPLLNYLNTQALELISKAIFQIFGNHKKRK